MPDTYRGPEQRERDRRAYKAYIECGITPHQLCRCYSCFDEATMSPVVAQTTMEGYLIRKQVEHYCQPCWTWIQIIYEALAPYFGPTNLAPEGMSIPERKKPIMN